MRSRVLMSLIASLLILTGCKPSTRPIDPKSKDTVSLRCDPVCSADCPSLPDWDGTLNEDRVAALLKIWGSMYVECDMYRQACVQCIQRGVKAGVIKM